MDYQSRPSFSIDNDAPSIYHHSNGQYAAAMGVHGGSVMIDPEKMAIVIAEAEREFSSVASQLEALEQQLQSLQQQASHLQSFITLGKTLMGELPVEHNDISNPVEEPIKITAGGQAHLRASAADHARDLLEHVQRPMRVTDIARDLIQKGLVQGKWAQEVLRAGMGRREEFERITAGVYALRHWPAALKVWSESSFSKPVARRRSGHTGPRGPHGRLQSGRSLAEDIIYVLSQYDRALTPTEIEHEVKEIRTYVGPNTVSGTLSRLVLKDKRVERPELGRYALVRASAVTPATNGGDSGGNMTPEEEAYKSNEQPLFVRE
jgi:hypothetical protein